MIEMEKINSQWLRRFIAVILHHLSRALFRRSLLIRSVRVAIAWIDGTKMAIRVRNILQ